MMESLQSHSKDGLVGLSEYSDGVLSEGGVARRDGVHSGRPQDGHLYLGELVAHDQPTGGWRSDSSARNCKYSATLIYSL